MRRLALAVAFAATLAACGGAPDELSRGEGRELELARDRAVAAVDLEAELRRSPESTSRVLARVRKIVATGALEPRRLDEFGLAALGELRLVAPSLVVVDRLDVPRELDREALSALLAEAASDPSAASKVPARKEVERIERLLTDADAASDTRVPIVGATVGDYRDELAARLRATWPDLASEVSD